MEACVDPREREGREEKRKIRERAARARKRVRRDAICCLHVCSSLHLDCVTVGHDECGVVLLDIPCLTAKGR